MSPNAKPAKKPVSKLFSTGPTRKRPGWSPAALDNAAVGRSHRAAEPKARIQTCISKIHSVLELPADYLVGIVPGSDTGAVEMAMWSLLGARGVDILGWEAFGCLWVAHAINQLPLENVTTHIADYGHLPDLSAVNFNNDVVFTWNGTAAGVRVPNGDWIPDDRAGLTIADSTSACFAMEIPWQKLDVVTFSFQKSLGGEGGHGVIILSPRAAERVNSYTPSWPMPKVLSLAKKGKLDTALFAGTTINTPSMLVIEDAIDALSWAENLGGVRGLIARVDASFAVMSEWVVNTPNYAFLAVDPSTVSQTSVCLRLRMTGLPIWVPISRKLYSRMLRCCWLLRMWRLTLALIATRQPGFVSGAGQRSIRMMLLRYCHGLTGPMSRRALNIKQMLPDTLSRLQKTG